MVAPAATTFSALAERSPAPILVLHVHRHGVRLGGDLGVEAQRSERHLHRIVLAAIELPVRRSELEAESFAGAHEGRHDVVLQSAVDRAAIEFVALEGRLDLPRSDFFGLAVRCGKRRAGMAKAAMASEANRAPRWMRPRRARRLLVMAVTPSMLRKTHETPGDATRTRQPRGEFREPPDRALGRADAAPAAERFS